MTDTARTAAVLGTAIAQPLAGQFSRLTGIGRPVEQRSETYTPVTPIGPAFGIWGPLFISAIRFGVRAVGDRHEPLQRDIGWLAATAFACNAAWELQADLDGFEWQSNAIIATGAAAASTAHIIAERGDYDAEAVKKVRFAIGTLAGWLTVATVANAEASRVEIVGRPRAARSEAESLALIGAASAAAAAIAVAANGSAHYAGGAAWGLGGVVIRNVYEDRPRIAAAAALGMGAVLAATLWARRTR